MNLSQFQTADQLIFGQRSIEKLPSLIEEVAAVNRVLIVTSNFLRSFDQLKVLEKELNEQNINVDILDSVQPEPTIGHIEELSSIYRAKNYDLVIGIGGGSVLDVTKLLAVMFNKEVNVRDLLGIGNVKERGLPTVLIPTTSGTGAEVTPNAIVTLPDEELKVGVVSKHLLPNYVILDPLLTLSLPKPITAATGMDAFTHSFESYISNKANPISDLFAIESMKLIAKSILKAYQEPSNIEARENMLLASTYGGMALTAAGTAAVHALAYPLGGKYHIPHGEANSMLLPHVTEKNLDVIEERMAKIAVELNLAKQEDDVALGARTLINEIKRWTAELNIPQDLSNFGITDENVEELAIAASKVTRLMDNNPKELSVEDIKEVYLKLL
ncbi:iron-containing alcohol dehydrogenase [Evansella halocellulosilytica]|uniref:iron-containing alcohol dehydrogenase n=1 Tax=Evansella halocellulosilytica TaxID=2011013 RepID=UPI000BB8516E|nr:iron-containing alcohol dehydrogenase [Evansella halocellulosilytica]